jgi:thiol-disulfide isomerase/thioredoxin
MKLNHITRDAFNQDLTLRDPLNQGKVIIIFYRDSCPACSQFKPTFIQAVGVPNQNVQYIAVNTEEESNQKLLKDIDARGPFMITGVPTVVGYFNGKFYSKFGGDRTVQELVKYGQGLGTAPVTFVPIRAKLY